MQCQLSDISLIQCHIHITHLFNAPTAKSDQPTPAAPGGATVEQRAQPDTEEQRMQPAMAAPAVAREEQRAQPTTASPAAERMAKEMVTTARTLGEQLEHHAVTEGDGNCFFHALLDQVRNRPEVSQLIPQNVAASGALTDHLTLRRAVVDFARAKVDDPGLLGMSENGFAGFLKAQARPSTFAEGCVIEFAAVFLGVDIWLISDQNTTASPYTKMSSLRAAEAHIVLGYIPGLHFQSLYPIGQVTTGSIADEPPAKKTRLSDADRKRLARAVESEDARKSRLAEMARRQAESRQAESSAIREERLAADALHKAQARQVESSPERAQRLTGNARRNSQTRQAETPAEREQRLTGNASRMSQTRQAETPAARQQRLAAAAEAMSQLRDSRRSQVSTPSDAMDDAEAAEPPRPSFWDHGMEFHKSMAARKFHICDTCSEIDFIEVDDSRYRCKRCIKDPITFSAENNMDPGPVPHELAGLSPTEQLLISIFIPMMTVVRLPRGGQYGFRGNVINLPQDLPSLVTCLPRRVTDTDIIVVRKQGQNNTHHDFRVRRNVVHGALLWLKQNNPRYGHIDISDDNLHLLPEDDIVDVRSMDESDAAARAAAELMSAVEDAASSDDDVPAEMASSFVPLNIPQPTETATVEALLEPIQWPTVTDRPVNEFETDGYVTGCFPTLLPTGCADLRPMGGRDKRVPEAAYFRHLLRYKDQRFAQNPRFVYFAYNTLLRHRVLATGRMYLRQHPESTGLTLEQVKQMPEAERRQLARSVVRFGGHQRGSQQYWSAQRQYLVSLIDQLGTPHCFFTLSAADMQWPDLQGYLRQFGGVQTPSAAVANNPLICTWYMYERVSLFIETFLRDVLSFEDFFARNEFQARGSLHTHGVAYLREGKDVAEVVRLAETFPDRLAEYVDGLVTAWHPAPPVPGQPFVPPVPHPCAKRFEDVDDFESDYESLVNCVQRHTRCATGYCLRKKRGSDVAECRFGYPKDLADTTTVTVNRSDNDKVEVTVEPRRNDPLLNCHNRAIVQTWRGNVDFQLIHDRRKVVEYLAKYISKAEPVSKDFKDLLDAAIRGTDASAECATTAAIQRLLIKAVCERDISAQEVCHLVLELPLVLCSRQFHVLAVDGGVDGHGRLTVERELASGTARKCDLDKYVARDPEREALSMVEYFKKHYRTRRNSRGGERDAVRRKELIVRVVPRLVACPSDPEKHIRFCRQQLVLHKPFRQVEQLTAGYADAIDAYNAWIQSQESSESDADIEAEVANYQHDSEDEPVDDDDAPDQVQPRPGDEWIYLLRRGVCDEQDNVEQMCQDYMDYDWAAPAASYDVVAADTFVTDQRRTAGAVGDVPHVSADSLVGNQREAFDLVSSHAEGHDAEPLRAIFSGTAGTGKSHLIHAVRSHLGDRCKVVAPTGVAAFNVSGTTAHHLFHLPVQKACPFAPLSGASLRNLQDEHDGVFYYIIDEMSMIGCRTLGMIDERLRQAFPNAADQVFGGRSVILVGDFGQLPPVCDAPLWSEPSTSRPLDKRGQSAFSMFHTAVVLDRVVRQAGDTEFSNALLRLRNAETTDADYKLFTERFVDSLFEDEAFQSAVRLYPTHGKERAYNKAKLNQLHCRTNPLARILAEHRPDVASARKAEPEDAGGLVKQLVLARDARVMLTNNLWVDAGLVNGCVGHVVDIVYSGDKRPPALPDFVVCRFPQYRGPAYSGPNTVPIKPVQRTWKHDSQMLSRIQLPLALAWAITIHKSQGLTLDKAVVDIGKKEFAPGQSFVAISRVRSSAHLRLHSFDKDRLTKLANNQSVQKRKNMDTRLRQMALRRHE